MVLDLCESTQISAKDDTMCFHLKQRLDSIAHSILYAHNVNFIKNTGDGFLATFPRSIDAFNAGKAIIATISERNVKSENPPIHVRIGLHYGMTFITDTSVRDIHGKDVNITFRIEPLQHNDFQHLNHPFPDRDRILCTDVFYQSLLTNQALKDHPVQFCGQTYLKGLDDPFAIYWVQ